jgi:CRISPR-associated protein Cas2
MFVAIAYDIPDDRRRNRLCKTLKNFGTHVQYSVFEAFLSPTQFAQMKEAVEKVIKPSEDLVRYYHLCDACRRRIEVTPQSIVTVKPLTIII